jgi:hypothetical protein
VTWLTLQAIAIVSGLAGVLLMLAGLFGRRVGPGLRCRGCGYDVADLIAEQSTCPECGRSLKGRKGTTTGARVRRNGLILGGVALLVPASAAGWYTSTITQPLSARATPLLTVPLWLGPPSANSAAARELLSRWRAGTLDSISRGVLIDWGVSAWTEAHPARGWQHGEIARYALQAGELDEARANRLVDQLLIDASDVSDTRRQRVALAIAGDLGSALRPRLEAGLQDPAQRAAAAMLLLDDLDNTPSEALVGAAIDALAAEPGDPSTGPAADRLPMPIEARRAARYLTHHAEICAPALRDALDDTSAQRRLLAAVVLTESMAPADGEAIGRVVAPHLEPNSISGDALLASRALLRAGPTAVIAAREMTNEPSALARLGELEAALTRGPPPHLERLAGPLPWQMPWVPQRLRGTVP